MQDAIDEFWRWFAKGPGAWRKPREDFDEGKLLEIYERVAERFPDLSPEIHWTPGKGYELVFSLIQNRDPESRRRAAPLIRSLVESALPSKVWKFSAFAKPVGWMDAFLTSLDLLRHRGRARARSRHG